MKFELKTESEVYSKSVSNIFRTVLIFTLTIVLCDVAFKLGIISKDYQIAYNSRLLSVEKSATNFKKLTKLSKIKSKQKIWEFCRLIVK